MTGLAELAPLLPSLIALGAAVLMFALDRGRRLDAYELATTLVLLPLAAAVALPQAARATWPALGAGYVVALLARDRDNLLQSECALKLLWVMVPAITLSWAGVELLALATGTPVVTEQWPVLRLGLDPEFLWRTALPLSLLLGLVLLAGAPFHFWAADLLQGAPAWLAPLALIALQISGAWWLHSRVQGIGEFPDAARAASALLAIAAVLAFAVGAVTLALQQRPERRVGTLAGLHGGLLLATIAFGGGRFGGAAVESQVIARWAGHLALALSGAGILAHFVPARVDRGAPPPVLFRRHPLAGAAGLYALGSLAGIPGTPGARVWLDAARMVAHGGHSGVMLALAAAWLAAFTAAARQAHEALGIGTSEPAPAQPVPWPARAALWACALGLVAFAWL